MGTRRHRAGSSPQATYPRLHHLLGLWGIERSSEDIVQEQFWSYPGGSAAACRRGHVAGIHWANFFGPQGTLEKVSNHQPPTFGSRGMAEMTSGK